MFKETQVKKHEGLRIFLDTDCSENLLVWYAAGAAMKGAEGVREFRLVYNLLEDAHCIAWRKKDEGEFFAHAGVDDGEGRSITFNGERAGGIMPKQSPVMVLNGVFEKKDLLEVAEDFLRRAEGVDAQLARFVYDKLLSFPKEQFVSEPHK